MYYNDYDQSKKTIASNASDQDQKLDNFKKVMKNNREWAKKCTEQDPNYFLRLANIQKPKYLWIGCSDSRVPANQILGLKPGQVFVHRNIANVASPSDINCLAVIQFAVQHLQVEDIIVAGHYGCGGIKAAFEQNDFGPLECWISHLRQLRCKFRQSLLGSTKKKQATLVQLNIKHQVINVSKNSAVQQAWMRGQNLHIHGVVYSLEDGILRDLGLTTSRLEHVPEQYKLIKKNKPVINKKQIDKKISKFESIKENISEQAQQCTCKNKIKIYENQSQMQQKQKQKRRISLREVQN